MLVVHATPLPEGDEDEVVIAIRREKLASAWGTMQSCDAALWTDVCDLYAMVVAVDRNPTKFADNEELVAEVTQAKMLMQNAELLAAVETIESFNPENWKQETNPTCIRHGSMLMLHQHTTNEAPLEAKMHHLQHDEAWELMNNTDKTKWTEACHYHEEQNKAELVKKEKLEAALWVMQNFNSKLWGKRSSDFPKSMKHAATFTVHKHWDFSEESIDPSYKIHRKRLDDAWQTMKETDQQEWLNACKTHEGFVKKYSALPVRNGVVTHAA